MKFRYGSGLCVCMVFMAHICNYYGFVRKILEVILSVSVRRVTGRVLIRNSIQRFGSVFSTTGLTGGGMSCHKDT